MENLNNIISKNLIRFRTSAGLTQLELAHKLNYSDKSISKWERGEGLPDLAVLVALSKIYNISLNDFLTEEKSVKPASLKVEKKSRLLVCLLSVGLVVLVASICFAVLFIIEQAKPFAWLSYLFAIPVGSIVLLVFSELWGNRYLNALFAAMIVWGIILSVCLTVPINDIWIICVIGIVLTILIIFWYLLRFVSFQKKSALTFLNVIFKKCKNENKNEHLLNKENSKKINENITKLSKEKLVFNSIKNESDNT